MIDIAEGSRAYTELPDLMEQQTGRVNGRWLVHSAQGRAVGYLVRFSIDFHSLRLFRDCFATDLRLIWVYFGYILMNRGRGWPLRSSKSDRCIWCEEMTNFVLKTRNSVLKRGIVYQKRGILH